MNQSIKFQKFYVTNGATKARVWYSPDNRADGRQCVTLFSKDYSDNLGKIFDSEYVNNTEIQTDYFEKGRVVLFNDHPLYDAARARCAQKAA